MERSADWLDQAMGNLAHAESDAERGFHDWACCSSGSPRDLYNLIEAQRLVEHARAIV